MIECHIEGSDTVELKMSDEVTAADYKKVTPLIEGFMAKKGRLKFLIVLDNLKSFGPGAIWEDLKFDIKHLKNVGDTAIVGESKAQSFLAKGIDKIFPAKVKYFERNQLDAAKSWLESV